MPPYGDRTTPSRRLQIVDAANILKTAVYNLSSAHLSCTYVAVTSLARLVLYHPQMSPDEDIGKGNPNGIPECEPLEL